MGGGAEGVTNTMFLWRHDEQQTQTTSRTCEYPPQKGKVGQKAEGRGVLTSVHGRSREGAGYYFDTPFETRPAILKTTSPTNTGTSRKNGRARQETDARGDEGEG